MGENYSILFIRALRLHAALRAAFVAEGLVVTEEREDRAGDPDEASDADASAADGTPSEARSIDQMEQFDDLLFKRFSKHVF